MFWKTKKIVLGRHFFRSRPWRSACAYDDEIFRINRASSYPSIRSTMQMRNCVVARAPCARQARTDNKNHKLLRLTRSAVLFNTMFSIQHTCTHSINNYMIKSMSPHRHVFDNYYCFDDVGFQRLLNFPIMSFIYEYTNNTS